MKYTQNFETVHCGKQVIKWRSGLKLILTESGCENDYNLVISTTSSFLMADVWLLQLSLQNCKLPALGVRPFSLRFWHLENIQIVTHTSGSTSTSLLQTKQFSIVNLLTARSSVTGYVRTASLLCKTTIRIIGKSKNCQKSKRWYSCAICEQQMYEWHGIKTCLYA